MSRHLPILMALKGNVLGDQDATLLSVEAQFLDGVQDWLLSVEAAIFPDTSPDPSLWESLLGLSGSGTLAERRARILSTLQATGGLSKAHFLELAARLGYGIEIATCPHPFRAGIHAAGDAVIDVNPEGIPDPPGWDASLQGPYVPALWTWTVTVLDLGGNDDSTLLQQAFEAAKPAYSSIQWEILPVMSKSKSSTIQTPTVGDEVAMLLAVQPATLQTLHAAVVGPGSVTLRLCASSSLGAGLAGSALAPDIVVTADDGALAAVPTISTIAAGQFIYLVVVAVSGNPTTASAFFSYSGGE